MSWERWLDERERDEELERQQDEWWDRLAASYQPEDMETPHADNLGGSAA